MYDAINFLKNVLQWVKSKQDSSHLKSAQWLPHIISVLIHAQIEDLTTETCCSWNAIHLQHIYVLLKPLPANPSKIVSERAYNLDEVQFYIFLRTLR